MTNQEIANRHVELCRKGEYDTCYKELYSQDAVSIEPKGKALVEVAKGMEEFATKGKKWNESMEEFYGSSVSEPIVADDYFCVSMMVDCKMKGQERSKSEELCIYKVENGKIVSEQFFY